MVKTIRLSIIFDEVSHQSFDTGAVPPAVHPTQQFRDKNIIATNIWLGRDTLFMPNRRGPFSVNDLREPHFIQMIVKEARGGHSII